MTPRREVIGDCTLWLGDCRTILETLGHVDAVLTDAPYGIAHQSHYGASWADTSIAGDEDVVLRNWVAHWAGDRPAVFFGTWKTPPPPTAKACVIWDKGPAFGMGNLALPWKPSFELAYICGRGWTGRRAEGVVRGPVVVSWESRGRQHPHEKPPWLLAHFLERLPHAQIICDPFAGVASTALACISLGRNFVGCEIDPHYFAIACRRIEAAYKQPNLFLPRAAPPAPTQPALFAPGGTS